MYCKFRSAARVQAASLGDKSPNTPNLKGVICLKEKTKSIYVRVTPQEKIKIVQVAGKCSLSLSEYLRKRALGYSPKAVLPDAFYSFYAKLCELCNSIDGMVSSDVEEKLLLLIDDIRSELLLPSKETVSQIKTGLEEKEWQPQDSGQLKES